MKQMYHKLHFVLKGLVCMKRIIDLIFYRKKLVILLFSLILIYGIYSYFVIPKQEMPALDPPYMVLTIIAPSLNANDLDETVIDDIEKLILTYGDVTKVQSYIYDNYAVVVSEFSFSTEDPDKLSSNIFNKINTLSLSESVTDISYSSTFDDLHIIFAVHSDILDNEDLLTMSKEFKNELLLLDEVDYVNIDSVYQNEVIIRLNTESLQIYSIELYDVYQLLYANTLNIPLGGITTAFGVISINGNVELNDIALLENMIIIPEIPTVSPVVLLKDIAAISIENTSNKLYKFDNETAVFLSLHFEDDIDFTKMGDEIMALKASFMQENPSLDFSIDEMLFLPDYVDEQIDNVFNSLLIAIFVVMVIVLIGIGFRNSLLIVITIPLIIFSTIAVLYLFDYELHKLTIVGLIVAIGILVDNSIVITEGIKLNIDSGLDKVSSAKKAILDNSIPVLSSTLTTIAAFIVLVLLPGFLGKIVSSMPLTVIIAISLSYIVSMVLSPILATLFLKESNPNKKKKTSIHEKNIKSMIGYTIKFPILWIFVSVTLFGLSVFFAFKTLPIDLYPNDERSVLYIDVENNELGDLDSTEQLNLDIIEMFKDNPRVLNYSTSIGGNLPSFHFGAPLINERKSNSRIYINFDYNEKELLKYKKELEETLKTIENSKITVSNIELSPPLAPLMVTIKSDDLDLLEASSVNMFNEIKSLDSVKSYVIVSNIDSVKYNILYDFEKIGNAFLTIVQIDQIIALNLNSLDLNQFTYNEELINIILVSDIEEVIELEDLSIYSEILDTTYTLGEFIQIETSIGYSVINKIDNIGASYIELYFTDDSDLNELTKDVKEITGNYDNENIIIEFNGENEMFKEISGDLIRASIIAIVLIYIIMFIQFNNFVKPLIVYLTIPLSFTGSFAFLIIFNSPITATSLIGMVSLIGVTVNTGILLVEYISRNHQNGNDIKQACVDAVYARFRPIMLTSFTTILGLIPLLISGRNFFQPLAITFMGGMVSSTVLTIFLVPSVYYLVYRTKDKKKTSE